MARSSWQRRISGSSRLGPAPRTGCARRPDARHRERRSPPHALTCEVFRSGSGTHPCISPGWHCRQGGRARRARVPGREHERWHSDEIVNEPDRRHAWGVEGASTHRSAPATGRAFEEVLRSDPELLRSLIVKRRSGLPPRDRRPDPRREPAHVRDPRLLPRGSALSSRATEPRTSARRPRRPRR